jgi:hypothetical protein
MIPVPVGTQLVGTRRLIVLGILGSCLVVTPAGASSSSSSQLSTFCRADRPGEVLSPLSIRARSEVGVRSGVSLSKGSRLSFVVDRPRVIPGASIYARLINVGRTTIGYERESVIESYSHGSWHIDSASPRGRWLKSRGRLRPRSLGRCYRFNVPQEQPPGRYRFSTRVRLDVSASLRSVRKVAEFRVESVPRAERLTTFCTKDLAHDYLEPLRRMPVVRHVPASGTLSFAPRGLSLYVLGGGLRVGKGMIGFAFSDEAIDSPRRLNWVVKSRLTRVNAFGQSRGLLASKTNYLGTQKFDHPAIQGFLVAGHPAYYRVDIAIGRRSGAILGRYGEYFRVVRPRFQAQLAISDDLVAPDQVLYARIENIGTEPILPSSRMQVERYDGTAWVDASSVSVPGPRPHVRAVLGGGEAAGCGEYLVPEGQPNGRYRIRSDVSRTLSPESKLQVALFAEFRIAR